VRSRGLVHVHSHSCGPAALIAMLANRLAGVSYSLTLHGEMIDYGPQQNIKYRYASFVIAITKKLRAQIIQSLGANAPDRIGLAPMGVDTMVFKRSDPYIPWSGRGSLRLFACGRLNYVKGHQDLIQAVKILRDEGLDVALEIAGEDDIGGNGYRKTLEILLNDLGLSENVSLLGAVSEQRILQGLCNSHLFVLASHHEPLGVAIMEALSCGTPVVATNLGGVPEMIDHGIDGYLVAPKDAYILATAIKQLASDKEMAKNFSHAGRAKVIEKFGTNVSAGELKRLISICVPGSSDASL
jgi:colanic acid/amylovoran biosynthesis glycosyltransferase